MRLRILVLVCLLGITTQIFSQITLSTDTVEVFGRNSNPVTKPLPTSSTTTVLEKKTLEDSGESMVLKLLPEYIPGLFVTERGVTGFGLSNGSAGIVNIRGVGGGNKVLMLFDGQPQWAGIFGHALPDTYSMSDAEQVIVMQGPASLFYGSGAMGGAINIITHRPQHDGIYGKARAMYGSYNTQKYMASAGGKDGKFSAFASLNYDRTDGHRANSEFNTTNGSVKVGYDFSNHWQAFAGALVDHIDSHNPGMIQNPMIDGWVNALRATYSLSVENKYEKMSGAVQAFYNRGHHQINDGHGNDELPQLFLFNSNDYSSGGSVYESFRLLEGNSTTAGVDYKKWGGRVWNDTISNRHTAEIVNKSVNELGAYIFTQQTIRQKLTVNAGIRLEMNQLYGNEWIPQVGIAYDLNTNAGFKASVSKGFRSPNIRELYMYPPANPDLRPESMINYDISYSQRLLDNRLNFGLTAYYIDGKNMIETIMRDGRPENLNTGSFVNKGFELFIAYKALPSLQLTANYSFLNTDVPLLAAPKHKSFLSVEWKIGQFIFSPNFQYVGGLYTSIDPPLKKENYALLNARINYKVSKCISLFVNGENLTNTDYEINYGFPMPGIVVLGGIDLKFN
ncbi:MAG: TonB-dependent receptor [Candidatus Azobacteroides sp.]|nr:TonB-dependent receptor [Candidatus Azobacteroides sp.]